METTEATADMEEDRLEALVRRAERISKANPRDYRQRVVALAILGHLVLYGTAVALLAVIGIYVFAAYTNTNFLELLFGKALVFPIAVLIFVLGRALWASVPIPQGTIVTRAGAPRLFDELDRLTRVLKTPAIHEVRLSDEFNAALVQVPRLGPLGWPRRTLVIGLQLLMALTPTQARAVVAHELGHLSRRHGVARRWVYQARDNWCRVWEAYSHDHSWGGGLMRRFFEWYAPYFGAYSFVLARSFEYEADRVAAKITSREETGAALIATSVKADAVKEEFWPQLLGQAERQAQPVTNAYLLLAKYLRALRLEPHTLATRLRAAVAPRTAIHDSHPALADRLMALKARPIPPRPMRRSAAQLWLGDRYEQILENFSNHWAEQHLKEWHARFDQAQSARVRLSRLAQRPQAELTDTELWMQAVLTERVLPEKDPLPLYLAYLKRQRGDAAAEVAIGRLLLQVRKDQRGIVFVRRAAEHPEYLIEAATIAENYYTRLGNETQARIWRRLGEDRRELELASSRERATVRATDPLEPADLPDEWRDRLRRQLSTLQDVTNAHVARKRLNVIPDPPLYVLACQVKHKHAELSQTIRERITVPGDLKVVLAYGEGARLAEKVARVGERVK